MRNSVWAMVALYAFVSVSAAWADVPKEPTYSNDIARILSEKCVGCHRAGEIAPMSLTSYDEVRPWAKSIAEKVHARAMPPWNADKGIGEFQNDRSLDDDAIATIVRWVEQGAKQGGPKHAPKSPEYPSSEWKLGEPDLLITLDKVDLPAGGPDQFYTPSHQTTLPSDQWIRAVEIRPSNRAVTHHVIVYQADGADSQPNGWLGAWAAGAEPMEFPKGTGRLLKKGGTLVGDMHYHPAETPQSDQTRVGLYFKPESEIEKELINLWLDNRTFEIPAGDPDFEMRSAYTFPQDSIILSVMPHMHYRGKSFRYVATYPNGRTATLMSTSNYDFNWQTNYIFRKPIKVPKGTQIECVATWDNSANNPRNPDPTRTVTFGNASTDEMMIGFVDYVVADGLRPQPATDHIANTLAQLVAERPGDAYDVTLIDNAPNPRPARTALFLPRTGEGTWQLDVEGLLVDATLEDVAWQGDVVTAKAKMGIMGNYDFKATVDASTGELKGGLSDKGQVLANLEGTRAK